MSATVHPSSSTPSGPVRWVECSDLLSFCEHVTKIEHVSARVMADTSVRWRATGTYSGSGRGGPGWANGSDIPRADWIRRARDGASRVGAGWAGGTALLDSARSALAGVVPTVGTIRRRPRWSEDGDEPDAARLLLDADPAGWIGTTRVRRPGTTIVRVLVPVGGSWDVPAEGIRWSGAVGIVFADALERAGYRTDIVGVYGYGDFNGDAPWVNGGKFNGKSHGAVPLISSFVVKGAEEPLDIERAAIALVHPGFFRTVVASTVPVEADAVGGVCGNGYGNVMPIKEGNLPADLVAGGVICPRVHDRQTALYALRALVAPFLGGDSAP